ncbi:Eco57I restriction-modification methylase domain-containing protein [Companilactobacillus hulinensis]
MYMAQQSMRQAVTTKINELMNWNYSNFVDLGYKLRDYQGVTIDQRKKISDGIDSLKILDPAVGSGHFLVSVLNEVISLKSVLRVLFDADGNLMNDIQCSVINDELIVQDDTGSNFSYKVKNTSSLRIQKAIFNQKKIIIENCLYGVDLNPNSVNICRLRLWIELLKSSYYSENADGRLVLTTLPNIDVNVKVGDSLVHKFDLDSKFDLRRSKFKEYLELVRNYKDTSDKKIKANLDDEIQQIKSSFYASFRTPEGESFNKLQAKVNKIGQVNLFEKANVEEFNRLRDKAKKALISFQQSAQSPMYKMGLEWRMEFPEVLDENGDFVGFDVVIANPPYIFARNKSFSDDTKKYYARTYEVSEYQSNTYTLFMELGYNLLKDNGTFAYIVPNNLLTIQSTQKTRDFLCKKTGDLILINSLDKLFADASVDNCIVFFKKSNPKYITVGELYKGEYESVGTVKSDFFGKSPIFSISMVKYREVINVFWKMDNTMSLVDKKLANVKTGIKAYQTGKGQPKLTKDNCRDRIYHSYDKLDDSYLPYLDGNNVNRYSLSWNGEFIKYGDNLAEPRKSTNFKEPRILVRQIPTHSIYAINGAYTDDVIINDLNSMVIENLKINPYVLLGIINSKPLTLWFLMKFDKFQRRVFPQFKVNELSQFPIPDMSDTLKEKLIDMVMQILKNVPSESDNIETNSHIDEVVMEAFGFTEKEKESIRRFAL